MRPPERWPRRYAAASCRPLAGRDLGGTACAVPPEVVERHQLTLGELEALARALLPVFLAFLHTGVARQKSVLAQGWSKFRIETADGAGKPHAHRSGLPTDASAMRGSNHIHLLGEVCKLQRLGGVMQ